MIGLLQPTRKSLSTEWVKKSTVVKKAGIMIIHCSSNRTFGKETKIAHLMR